MKVLFSKRPTHCGQCSVIRVLHDRTNSQGEKILCDEPSDIEFVHDDAVEQTDTAKAA